MMAGLAQFAALLLLASPQDAPLIVLKTLDGPDLVKAGISAEVIGLPPAIDAAAFAAQVVDGEHLKSFDGGPMTDGEATSGLSYKALTAGDGRSVVVYYARDPGGPKTVCRLRITQSGFSDARYRALRWCALQVGVLLPDEPAPPVGRRGRR
jgi:hypothetical protein